MMYKAMLNLNYIVNEQSTTEPEGSVADIPQSLWLDRLSVCKRSNGLIMK